MLEGRLVAGGEASAAGVLGVHRGVNTPPPYQVAIGLTYEWQSEFKMFN